MRAVQPMKNTKSFEYEADVQEFRKAAREKRQGRNEQRASKRNYSEGVDV